MIGRPLLMTGFVVAAAIGGVGVSVAQVTKVAPKFAPAPGRAACRGARGYAEAFGGRRTFLWRPEWLQARKRALAADPAARAALRKAADAALEQPPLSVRDKTAVPASGDKGDYYSIGPYWWPDPAKPGGLPYVRRDGQVNPQRNDDTFDNVRIDRFTDRVETLALASYYLDDVRYARRAAALLRVWYLDPKTRMNPNLNFGQAVPGVSAGRAEGLIEMPESGAVIDSIGLIEPTGALSPAELAGLRDWFGRFAEWMQSSPIGRDERGRTNNHALYYDYTLTHFSLFAGRADTAAAVAQAAPARFLRQLDAKGGLPEEMARTRSWHYPVFALGAVVRMAGVAECVGVDMWSARGAEGRSLTAALDFLLPYQSGRERWPLRDLKLDDPAKPASAPAAGAQLYRLAAWGLGRRDYDRAARDDRTAWLTPLP